MLLPLRATICVSLASLSVVLFAGCPGDKPVSSTSSGLRPADEDEPVGDGKSDGEPLSEPFDSSSSDGEQPSTDSESDGGSTSEPDKPPTHPDPPANSTNNNILEVPEGGAAELVQYLEDVNGELRNMLRSAQLNPPSLEARDAFMAKFTRLIQSQLTAAKKILDDEQAEAEQRNIAAQTVFDTLAPLEQVGEEEAAKQAREIAMSLANDDDPKIRRRAAGLMMDEELDKIRTGEVDDPAALLKQMEVVFSGEPDDISMARFMSAQSAVQVMMQNEKPAHAVAIMNAMGEHFVSAAHPQLAQAGQDLLDQAKIIRFDDGVRKLQADVDGAEMDLLAIAGDLVSGDAVDVQSLRVVAMISKPLQETHPEVHSKLADMVAAAATKQLKREDIAADELLGIASVASDLGEAHAAIGKQATDALLAKIATDLVGEDLEPQVVGDFYSNVAVQAEYSGNVELAKQVMASLTEALPKVQDEDARESIKTQLEAAKKRVGLVGNPLTVEGALLDGKPFDWEAYKGKVVLIDFWATWCRPCLEEIPNILANYERYHEHGFEVIGVNIDEDPATAVEFFAARGDLPWATVVSNDPDAAGPTSAMAEKCGVVSIPFVVLVARDGNVLAIHVRGPELGQRLAELFPDVAVDEVPPVEDGESSEEPETDEAPEAE